MNDQQVERFGDLIAAMLDLEMMGLDRYRIIKTFQVD